MIIGDHDDVVARLPRMYRSRWDRSYVAAKLRTDPLYGTVFAALVDSDLPLLDLGCGLGILSLYLRCRGFGPPIVGLDYDRRKVEHARHLATEHDFPGLTFHHHDAREGLPGHSGNVTILDILQFFEPEQRRELLEQAAKRVAPRGILLIRSAVRDRSWRYGITVAGDFLAKATFWMKSAPVHYPDREEFREVLGPFGKLSITPLWGRTPFNNHLVILRRHG